MVKVDDRQKTEEKTGKSATDLKVWDIVNSLSILYLHHYLEYGGWHDSVLSTEPCDLWGRGPGEEDLQFDPFALWDVDIFRYFVYNWNFHGWERRYV